MINSLMFNNVSLDLSQKSSRRSLTDMINNTALNLEGAAVVAFQSRNDAQAL